MGRVGGWAGARCVPPSSEEVRNGVKECANSQDIFTIETENKCMEVHGV